MIVLSSRHTEKDNLFVNTVSALLWERLAATPQADKDDRFYGSSETWSTARCLPPLMMIDAKSGCTLVA